MLTKILLAAMMTAVATAPTWAASYYGQYEHADRYWAPYPNPTAALPYGWPIVAYTHSVVSLPVLGYAEVPVRYYYIPQHEPLYNVPAYAVVAPY